MGMGGCEHDQLQVACHGRACSWVTVALTMDKTGRGCEMMDKVKTVGKLSFFQGAGWNNASSWSSWPDPWSPKWLRWGGVTKTVGRDE